MPYVITCWLILIQNIRYIVNKQEVHISVQCSRINRKQYHSLNPIRFIRSIFSVVLTGSSVVENRRMYKHR